MAGSKVYSCDVPIRCFWKESQVFFYCGYRIKHRMEEHKLRSQPDLALNPVLPLPPSCVVLVVVMVVRGSGGNKGGSVVVAPLASWWGPENSHLQYPYRGLVEVARLPSQLPA